MLTILIILLGCNIATLLYDRINTALSISSAYTESEDQVDWFLSGGIKDPTSNATTSEAARMGKLITQYNKNGTTPATNTWNYIYDTNSQNTAENFIMVDKYLKTNGTQYDRVYVVTSQFHYERAKRFQSEISPGSKFEWVLSPMELKDSTYWENIHIQNVEQDIERAFQKYYHVM
jgi:hypothetical protein